MIWKTLGTVAPGELIDARLQLHHAAQVVASAGAHFIAPEPDDSHPNLGWDESLGALVGHALPGAGFRAGLRLADLSLLLIDEAGTSKDELSLDGRTLEDGHAWLAGATRAAGMEVPGAGLTRVAYEIPAHPTGEGAAFSAGPGDAFAELARWFANGHEAILTGSALLDGPASGQADRLSAFLESAIAASRLILAN